METLAILSDQDAMRELGEAEAAAEAGQVYTLDESTIPSPPSRDSLNF